MAVKYGEFKFPKEFGFHGSSGQSEVKGYMRRDYAKGGHVKSTPQAYKHGGHAKTTLTTPDHVAEPHYPGAPVNYKHGGDVAVRSKEAPHGVSSDKRFHTDAADYAHGGKVAIKHRYAKGGKAKGDRREYGESEKDYEGTHEAGELGESAKEKRISDADQYAHGGHVGGKPSTPDCYAMGGMTRAPRANRAIHAKTHKPTAGMRGLGALGQAAGPSMAPMGAPPGGAPGMVPPPLGAPPPGMKRGGRHHK